MTTTEWAVRSMTVDGPYYTPAASQEDAQSVLESLNRNYGWPEENQIVTREVPEWRQA